MRTTLLLVSALAVGGAALASPASAADTVITLPVGVTGTLSIAAPTAVVVPGSPASATIATTVTDLRLANTVGWTATISATDLTLVGATTPGGDGTIPATTMSAYTGDVEPTVPGVATIGNEFTSASPLALANTAKSFVVASSRSNVNTAIYTATVTIPTAGKNNGVYTGTVTQSVA